MSETVNQENDQAIENEVKTFTQEEVNAIVKDRLTRAGAKYADYDALKEKAEKFDQLEEANKTELQKATERAEGLQAELDKLKNEYTVREMREKVAKETGVPVNLLTGGTEEDCRAQAKAIAEYAKPSAYPKVRDGGEVQHTTGGANRDKFKDWFEANISH